MSTNAKITLWLWTLSCWGVIACGAENRAVGTGGGTAGAAIATIESALPSAASILPGKPCDPKKDGWMPTPIPPLSPNLQMQLDRGQEVGVPPPPPGYVADAPVGEPFCAPDASSSVGGRWAVYCKADGDCPVESRCNVFGGCELPCSSDKDCEPPKLCEQGLVQEGIGTCRCLACERRAAGARR